MLKAYDLDRFNRIIGVLKDDETQIFFGGGCLADNTSIRLMDDSFKSISFIEVGDIVATPNSSQKEDIITNVFSINENCLVSINNRILCSLSQPLMITKG